MNLLPLFALPICRPQADRICNWLFGKRVRPRPGSIVHCSLAVFVEHSGVVLNRDKIAEVLKDDDGVKLARIVDPDDFIKRQLPTGFNIHVACDSKTGVVLGTKTIAERAEFSVGRTDEYFLLFDNCHKFTSSCITGDCNNVDTSFTFLQNTISRKMNRGRPISWKVWNYEDDEDPSPDGLDEQLEAECAELDYNLIQSHEMACDDGIRFQLHEELRDWQQQLIVDLRQRFADNFAALETAKHSLEAGHYTKEDIQRDLQAFGSADHNTDMSHWQRRIGETLDDITMQVVRTDIQREWQRSLERQRSEYYLNEISRRREILFKELDGRLRAMQHIADVAGELGIEPGLLWDHTRGVGVCTDLDTLKRWSDYLKNNEGVRRLCELLGRMRRVSTSERIENLTAVQRYHITIPDIEARSEIVGIMQGRDLNHLLPQELALLADPDTEIFFDLKYAEGRLMSYEYEGMVQEEYEREHHKAVTVETEEKLGPMIICVDTSGSMSGEPECVAKAVTLALVMKSIEQKRDCCLYSFSTGVAERDMSKNRSLPELLDFLQMSFLGGTDAGPAIHHAIKKMGEEAYDRADLLVVSDFVMPELTTDLKQQIKLAKERGCRFHALSIGRPSGLAKPYDGFDQEWQYDPSSIGITELNKVVACGAR